MIPTLPSSLYFLFQLLFGHERHERHERHDGYDMKSKMMPTETTKYESYESYELQSFQNLTLSFSLDRQFRMIPHLWRQRDQQCVSFVKLCNLVLVYYGDQIPSRGSNRAENWDEGRSGINPDHSHRGFLTLDNLHILHNIVFLQE